MYLLQCDHCTQYMAWYTLSSGNILATDSGLTVHQNLESRPARTSSFTSITFCLVQHISSPAPCRLYAYCAATLVWMSVTAAAPAVSRSLV